MNSANEDRTTLPIDAESVELILFDAVGTLIYPEPSVAAVYQALATKFGICIPTTELKARFQAVFCQAYLLSVGDFKTSEAGELTRWRSIVHGVFHDAPEAVQEPIFNGLWQHFAQPEHWRLFGDVESTLAELKQGGYRIAIASNFDERLLPICRGIQPLAVAETVFVSSAVGWSKPGPGFYRSIESATGLQGPQLLMVGDDFENDVAAPGQLGWQTRWLVRESTKPSAAIAALTDLLPELPGK